MRSHVRLAVPHEHYYSSHISILCDTAFECIANAEPNTGASSSISIVAHAERVLAGTTTTIANSQRFREQSHADTNVHNRSGGGLTARAARRHSNYRTCILMWKTHQKIRVVIVEWSERAPRRPVCGL